MRADKKRMLRIIAMLEARTYTRFLDKEDSLIQDRVFDIGKKDPELFNDAVFGVTFTNDIELLTKALIRQKLIEDLNDLRTRRYEGLREEKDLKLQGQFVRIMPALCALNFKVENQASIEDLELRKESIDLLVELFPKIVDDPQNIDYNNDVALKDLKNRLFNELKNNYIPEFHDNFLNGKFKDVKNLDDIIEIIDARTAYRVKDNLLRGIADQGVMYEKIQKKLTDPAVLKFMERESRIEKKELLEDGLYLDFTNELFALRKLKAESIEVQSSKNKDSIGINETELVLNLITMVQLYDAEGEDRRSGKIDKTKDNDEKRRSLQLLNEAKRNLADFLPNAFDEKGNVKYDILEAYVSHAMYLDGNEELLQEYNEYEERMTADSENLSPYIKLEFLSKRVKDQKLKEIESKVNNIDSKKETIKEISEAKENLNKINAETSTLRILQVIHYISDKQQDRKAEHFRKKYGYQGKFRVAKNTGTIKNAIEEAESVFKEKLLELYGNDEEKLDKAIDKIKDSEYDDTVFPGLIREGKRRIVNKRLSDIAKKYDKNDNEFDDETKEMVIATYLAALEDTPDKFIYETQQAVEISNNRLKKYLSRINPDAVKDGKVDLDVVLEEYKKVTKKPDIDDLEDAKFVAEGGIIEDVLNNLKNQNNFTLAINSEAFRTRLKIDGVREKQENFELLQNIGDLLKYSMQTRYELSDVKKEEIDLIKGLYLTVQLYGDENLNKKGLSRRNDDIQSVERDLLGVAKENLAIYFNGILDEDKEINKDKLDEAFMDYLEKNDPDFAEKVRNGGKCTDLIKQEIKGRKQEIFGPVPVDAIDKQIIKMRANLADYKEAKEDMKCLAMIELVDKMRKRLYGNSWKENIAKKFDSKREGISAKINDPQYKMEISDSYIDSVMVMGARRQVEEINKEYFSSDSKKLNELPARNKLTILGVAIGSIEACENVPDYKAITKGYDAKNVAIDIVRKIVPDAITSNREIDKEKLLEGFLKISEGTCMAKPANWEALLRYSNKKLTYNIVREFVAYDFQRQERLGEDLPYFEILENSELRSILSEERQDSEITNQEMNGVFQDRSETMHVAESQVKTNDSKISEIETEAEIEDDEVERILQDKAVELHHDTGKDEASKKEAQDKTDTKTQVQIGTEENVVEETSTPKVEQQSDGLNKDTKGIAVENINVAPVEQEKSMVTTESRGFISDVITKIKNIPNLIKNGINNIKDRLGIGQSSSSNNTETSSNSTSSTGGVVKTEQDVVQNLTGYGQQNLDLNAAKAATQNETGKKVSEKGNELEGNEENERD